MPVCAVFVHHPCTHSQRLSLTPATSRSKSNKYPIHSVRLPPLNLDHFRGTPSASSNKMDIMMGTVMAEPRARRR